jgi:hypothetical protein
MASEPRAAAAAPARWKKIKAERVADLGLPEPLGDEILEGLPPQTPQQAPEALVEALAEAGRHADAVRVLAFALPKREGVWWACLAAREDIAADSQRALEAHAACLKGAEAWVFKPVEERRLACRRAADACRPDRPAVLAALAAAFSGGSLTPQDSPPEVKPVPPDDSLTPWSVANAVVLAAVRTDPARAPRRFARFLAQGRDIAQGGSGAIDPEPPRTETETEDAWPRA